MSNERAPQLLRVDECFPWYVCSFCDCWFRVQYDFETHYCPHCGLKEDNQ